MTQHVFMQMLKIFSLVLLSAFQAFLNFLPRKLCLHRKYTVFALFVHLNVYLSVHCILVSAWGDLISPADWHCLLKHIFFLLYNSSAVRLQLLIILITALVLRHINTKYNHGEILFISWRKILELFTDYICILKAPYFSKIHISLSKKGLINWYMVLIQS